ncbi:MAG TPA: NAD(P)-dependent oxidoreductase [Nitrospinaceae bacterium]|nr:NAD(P)-dependent oxidoreductase [Nitrospinaceae bacterium]
MNPSKQKIVVTGASSFVGCHLTQGLSRINEWNVIPLGSKNSKDYKNNQIQRIEFSGKKKKWAVLDLRDEVGVKQFIRKFRPDIWVHHAGHASNYASPKYNVKDGYDTNVAPIRYIFKSLAENGCRGVIVTGSSLEYSNTDKVCLESDSCIPETPYGQSKLLETLTALEMSDRFDLPTRIARLFIPFGPLDNPNKLIHYVIDRLKNQTAVDLSPCKQKRDFIYINDVVKAYSLLIKDLDRGGAGIFNICSGQAISLENIINLIAEAIGAHKGLLNFGARTMRQGEQMISYGSNYKARETLEWEPGKVEEGLLKLINY